MSKKYSTSLVGIGALGSRFLSFFQNSKNFELRQIISTKSYKEFQIPNQIKIASLIENLDLKIEVVFICLPDSLIFEALEKIEQLKSQNLTVLCFSGALVPKQKFSFNYGFLHPVNSFPQKSDSHSDLEEIYWNSMGDSKFTRIANLLTQELRGKAFELKNEDLKPLYHSSCVIASNLLTSLLATAEESISKALNEPTQSKLVLKNLVEQSVKNFFESENKNALSGPVKRKDFLTVEKNLTALQNDFPEGIETYKTLSKNLLRILDKNFTQAEKAELLKILGKSDFE
ncbi:MAG: DUF2520 domain-containing protein [Calditrichaeota bacterium]|nr:MAG: DUF2520 domain-containing protein [Calditrichota bacterium]